MCDQDHFEEDAKKYTRRDMASLAAAGMGAAIAFPSVANAKEVIGAQDSNKTNSSLDKKPLKIIPYFCG